MDIIGYKGGYIGIQGGIYWDTKVVQSVVTVDHDLPIKHLFTFFRGNRFGLKAKNSLFSLYL